LYDAVKAIGHKVCITGRIRTGRLPPYWKYNVDYWPLRRSHH